MPRLLTFVVAVAVAGVAGSSVSHAAPSRFDTGTEDPLVVSENDPAGAYRAAHAEGMRYVRLPVAWSVVSGARPSHPADPDDPQYGWGEVDSRVRSILNHGMVPILSVYGAPPW